MRRLRERGWGESRPRRVRESAPLRHRASAEPVRGSGAGATAAGAGEAVEGRAELASLGVGKDLSSLWGLSRVARSAQIGRETPAVTVVGVVRLAALRRVYPAFCECPP